NVADTVIRLSVTSRANYSQRYIEITKSRLQREQRGEHPYSIKAGQGFLISPASSAVRSRNSRRSLPVPDRPVKFGLPPLEHLLGEGGLFAGDVVVLQGCEGT